jgi:hypothetical protein
MKDITYPSLTTVFCGIALFFALLTIADASVPRPQIAPPQKELVSTIQKNHKGGKWYMADDGHAIYCYGPQRMIPGPDGNLMKIATFCSGDRAIVKLRE